jgi:hypothetical protein
MMAGTIVGIAALTVIMAIGKGTESQVMKRVENFGPRAMMLVAGGGRTIGPPDLKRHDAHPGRCPRDPRRDPRSGGRHSAGVANECQLRHGTNQIQATMWGVEPQWHDAWNWYTAKGDGITDEDVATMARVCVIGSSVKRDLFGDADPIGESLYINKVA